MLTFITGAPLQISTVTTNVNLTFNQDTTININITNPPSNPTLFNIRVRNDTANNITITMANISNISSGTTKQTTITLKSTKSGIFTVPITFEGFRQINCSLTGPNTVDVSITSSGFSPSSISLCSGDSLRIINTLNITAYVVVGSGTASCTSGVTSISSGSSFTTSAITSGTYIVGLCGTPIYYDLIISGNTASVLTHSSSDDGVLNLNINNILQQTTVILESVSQSDFTMDWDEVKTSSLIIRNTGTVEAVKVELSGDWFFPTLNNFNIPAGSTRSVDIEILPDVYNPSDTNKSYTKILTIKAQNSNTATKPFNIFINYADEIAGEGDVAYLKYLDEIYCPRHPYSFLCEQQPRTIIKEVPKYACPDILARLTAEDVLKIINDGLAGQRTAEAAFNLISQYAESQNKTIEQVMVELNQSNILAQQNKEAVVDSDNTTFIIYFGTIAIIVVVILSWLLRKWYINKKKKERYG